MLLRNISAKETTGESGKIEADEGVFDEEEEAGRGWWMWGRVGVTKRRYWS